MRYILGVTTALLMSLVGWSANAVPVLQFAQTSGSNTITATANGTNTATTISGTDVAINITQDIGGFVGAALFGITATSVDAAVPVGTGAVQHYAGTFCITSGAGCSGTNYLSGTFTDAALGVGSALTLAVGAPPDTATFSSSQIASVNLGPPIAIAFSMTNVTPPITIVGTTIDDFTATVAGNFSANAVSASEPMTLALLGIGMLGLTLVHRKRS